MEPRGICTYAHAYVRGHAHAHTHVHAHSRVHAHAHANAHVHALQGAAMDPVYNHHEAVAILAGRTGTRAWWHRFRQRFYEHLELSTPMKTS